MILFSISSIAAVLLLNVSINKAIASPQHRLEPFIYHVKHIYGIAICFSEFNRIIGWRTNIIEPLCSQLVSIVLLVLRG